MIEGNIYQMLNKNQKNHYLFNKLSYENILAENIMLKNKLNIGAVSFTADGKKVYYTKNQKKSNNTYQLEIWESYFIGGKWVGAHKMFFNNANRLHSCYILLCPISDERVI